MRWLPAVSRGASAWKNGGGVTREVAVFPVGSGLDTFQWRLSIASIQSSGPFSRFDGVDRILAVISPGSLLLRRADGRVATLDGASPPYQLAGEESVTGELPGAPLDDINLMLRRGTHSGSLERMHLRQRCVIGERDAETIVVALDPVNVGGTEMTARDAAWLEAGEAASLSPRFCISRVMIARVWPLSKRRKRRARADRLERSAIERVSA